MIELKTNFVPIWIQLDPMNSPITSLSQIPQFFTVMSLNPITPNVPFMMFLNHCIHYPEVKIINNITSLHT